MRKKLTDDVMAAIRIDREQHGLTLVPIMHKYGLSRGTAYKAIAKMDGSRVIRAASSSQPRKRVTLPSAQRPALSKANLGEAARQVIAGRMMLAGLSVFRPLSEDTTVDLLVLCSNGVALKCQCKTMYLSTRSGVHIMELGSTRKWGPNAKAVFHRYTPDEVDVYLGYVVETDTVFVFPSEVTSSFKSRLLVWVLRTPSGNNGKPRFDAQPFRDAFHLLHR